MRIGNCTAALLCGGKSRRMGFDKLRLQDEYGGFLLPQSLEKLGENFTDVVLVAAQGQNLADVPGLADCSVWRDNYPETGPLGGVCTALELAKTPWVFVVACDMPQPDFMLAQQLYAGLGNAQAGLYQREGRLEPLFAFYHKSCLPVFQNQLAAGQLRLRDGFSQLHITVLPAPKQNEQKNAFFNINTPRDLANWQTNSRVLEVPQMVMVGSFSRNRGKTTLATALIDHWHRNWPVYGLKVVCVDENKAGKCHRGAAGCGLCTGFDGDFVLEEDFGNVPGKDTTRLLHAGAKRVFLLRSKRNALPKAMKAFLQQVPQDALIVCESNSLRRFIRPGVFLLASSSTADADGEDIKPSAQAVAHLADAVVSLATSLEEKMLHKIEVQALPQGGLRVHWNGSALAQPE